MPGLNIKPDIDYLKTPQAILKIVQIVTLLIAFSLITDCCDGGKPYFQTHTTVNSLWISILRITDLQRTVTESEVVYYSRNVSFFLAVTIQGWLLVAFLFTFFFLKLHERFKQINWEMVVMIISIVWSVLLLLCCSLMGNISSTAYKVRSLPTGVATNNIFLKRYVDTLVSGVVFGFFSLIAFIADAAFLFWQFWSKKKAGDNSSPNNPAITKVSEAPGPSGSMTQDQAQTLEAPPKYEAVQNLPGQPITNPAGQQVPYTAGQTVAYTAGQTATNPAGQTMVMYPSGQPVQMWQMA